MTTPQVARAWRVAALVAAALGLAQAAAAQAPSEEQRAAIRAACRSDYIAHCAGVPPGGAQALACLREHLASVSPECQQAVNAIGTAAPAAAPAAPAPAPAPAPAATVSPAPAPAAAPAADGRAAAALQRMQPNDEQFGVILEACGPDIDSHCANAERGPGWQLQCLHENAASLSTGCEQVLVAVASTAPAAAAAAPPAPAAAPPPAPAPAAAPAPPPASAAPRALPTRGQIIAIFQSCRRDMRDYCAGGRDPGASLRCLRDNAANLSPGCQQALAAAASGGAAEPGAGAPPPPPMERPMRPVSPREVFFLIRTACAPDFRAYCGGIGFGGGRAIGCLRENAANLSPTCRNALASMVGRR
jgi:hypothetical protein